MADTTHPLTCRCGKLKGEVAHPEKANRGVCYCKDCQAFARFLGNPGEILDENDGTGVVATQPEHVRFTEGVEHLACLSLSGNGLLRWYASCCNTPIGNTVRDVRVSFVTLVHTCLENPPGSLERDFGPVRMRVNTKGAKSEVAATPVATVVLVLGLMSSMLRARLSGSYKQTPFFDPASGTPVVPVVVLTAEERARATGPGDGRNAPS
jgi:hypothetical protein